MEIEIFTGIFYRNRVNSGDDYLQGRNFSRDRVEQDNPTLNQEGKTEGIEIH